MLWMIIAILILAAAIVNIDKINEMFNKPTLDEVEAYQDIVFTHIDAELDKFKGEVNSICEGDIKLKINELENLINTLDSKITECKQIEERIDKKLSILNSSRKLL